MWWAPLAVIGVVVLGIVGLGMQLYLMSEVVSGNIKPDDPGAPVPTPFGLFL